MFRFTVCVTLSCAFALACAGQPEASADASGEAAAVEAGPGDASPMPMEAQVAAASSHVEGRQLYESLCWACHGHSGRGDGPATRAATGPAPPNFQDQAYATLSASEIQQRFAGMLEGSDTTHPHMRSVVPLLDPARFMDALAFVPMLAYPAEIPGSALMGGVTFQNRCAPCHGRDGKGMGDLSSVLLIPAADLTTDPFVARADFQAVFDMIKTGGSATVHGSSMPTWGAVFGDGEIWDLVAYVATLQPGVLSPPRM